MSYRTSLIGIASAAGVLAVMVAARLLVSMVEVPDALELREVEIATLPEPPPPPPPPPENPPIAPPPPALTSLSDIPDPTRLALPEVDVPQPIDFPVDPFHVDQAPAPLPTPPAPRVASRPAPRETPPQPEAKRPASAPRAKSHYGLGELDGKPRLIHHPSVSFPRSLAAQGVRAGTVVLEVELSTSGRVSVRRVVSASHPELVSKARYVANGARYTPPRRGGQPVQAIMRWPITITQ